MTWFYIALAVGIFLGLAGYLAQKECPHCRKRIDRRATTCPFCRNDLPEQVDAKPTDIHDERLARRFGDAPGEEERPRSSFEKDRRGSSAWVLVAILGGLILALILIYAHGQASKKTGPTEASGSSRSAPVVRAKYEVLRQWEIPCGGKGGIGMEILVDESATRQEVMSLARYLRSEHGGKGCIFFSIYDSRDAWLDRLDAMNDPGGERTTLRLPETEYWRHFLVDAVRNSNTGVDKVDWVAEGRDH